MEEKFCSAHQWIEEVAKKVRDNDKFYKRLFKSKLSYIFYPLIFLAVCGWVGWVSKGTYAKELNKEKIVTICAEVKEIREENKTREEKRDIQRENDKKEIKEDSEKRDERERHNQERMMKILLDIQKQIKK